jgi:G3E family GTPase
MSGQIPVTVIGGYLGAGKTTLLNRMLAGAHGLRLAVLVNDFGSVNIDAALIESRDGETISLTNGCICCSIGDGLAAALHDLAERPEAPDHIVIEASGVADPATIAGYAMCHPRLGLDGMVILADAETVRARADDKYVGDLVRRQLAAADVIMLSKTDLVDNETCRQVQRWIVNEVRQARLIAGAETAAIAELLLGNDIATHPPAPVQPSRHARQFAAWTFRRHQPLDGAALRAAIAALPSTVMRAKGIVSLAEAPDARFVLQLVGRRWSLEAQPGQATPFALSEIVCIGLAEQLDPARLEVLFAPVAPGIAAPALRALMQPEATP